ncbi:MAG: hypothetical protein EA376_07870 [Phycisphaeraceae bacterium]|nr:MAG: hypothetical protein EA376_07870 [Phycisphaeraceae bacterium]
MDKLIEAIAEDPSMFVNVLFALSSIVIIGATIVLCMRIGLKMKREQEISRREIAAYVAEGSISAEDAESLLQPRPWFSRGKTAEKIKEACRGLGGL